MFILDSRLFLEMSLQEKQETPRENIDKTISACKDTNTEGNRDPMILVKNPISTKIFLPVKPIQSIGDDTNNGGKYWRQKNLYRRKNAVGTQYYISQELLAPKTLYDDYQRRIESFAIACLLLTGLFNPKKKSRRLFSFFLRKYTVDEPIP